MFFLVLLVAGAAVGALPGCVQAVHCPQAELLGGHSERALAWALYECEREERLRGLARR